MGHPTFGTVSSELLSSKERIIFHILLMQYARDPYRGLALNVVFAMLDRFYMNIINAILY